MKTNGWLLAWIPVVAVGAVLLAQGDAWAVAPFKKIFEAKYVKKNSPDEHDKTFAKAVAKAKCNTCHQGKTKKKFNPYGTELSKLLDRKKDKKDKEKIKSALDQVAELKSDPKNESSPSFGELIEQGQLPGGKP